MNNVIHPNFRPQCSDTVRAEAKLLSEGGQLLGQLIDLGVGDQALKVLREMRDAVAQGQVR